MSEISDCRVVSCLRSEIIIEDSKYKLFSVPYHNDIFCGDNVIVSKERDAQRIKQCLARTNLLSRKRRDGRIQKIAANITHLIIVSDLSRPINTQLIDNYLIACTDLNIRPIFVFNKYDIKKDSTETEYILDTYRTIENYQVIVTSAITDYGIDTLHTALDDATAVLVGFSGVGKTSIINRLIPDLNARVADISKIKQRGRHTTTEITLYRINHTSSALIDSPGIRSYDYTELTLSNIRNMYEEFLDYSGDCSFADCKHYKEPNCAVIDAVNAGKISQFRYNNYLHLLELRTQ